MSEETVTPESNPYNAKKSWINYDNPRGLQGANDSLAYQDPKPSEKEDKATQDTKTKEEEEVSNKYNKVDYKKRYDDMKRHYDNKLVEWKAKEEELQALVKSSAPKFVPKTPEELATFKEQYSDVYDVVESVAHIQAQKEVDEVKKEVKKLQEQEFNLRVEKAMMELERIHPDFHEISDSDEFHEWAKVQPSIIQEWIYENPTDASLASRAIDLYKKDTGKSPTDKKQDKRTTNSKKTTEDTAEAVITKGSNVAPSTDGKKIWLESEIAQLSIKQFEELENEIQTAFREGRVRK